MLSEGGLTQKDRSCGVHPCEGRRGVKPMETGSGVGPLQWGGFLAVQCSPGWQGWQGCLCGTPALLRPELSQPRRRLPAMGWALACD